MCYFKPLFTNVSIKGCTVYKIAKNVCCLVVVFVWQANTIIGMVLMPLTISDPRNSAQEAEILC